MVSYYGSDSQQVPNILIDLLTAEDDSNIFPPTSQISGQLKRYSLQCMNLRELRSSYYVLNLQGKQCVIQRFSDVQGFVPPPRVRGRGQEGKGRGQDFLTLIQTPTLLKGWGFCEGKSSIVNR